MPSPLTRSLIRSTVLAAVVLASAVACKAVRVPQAVVQSGPPMLRIYDGVPDTVAHLLSDTPLIHSAPTDVPAPALRMGHPYFVSNGRPYESAPTWPFRCAIEDCVIPIDRARHADDASAMTPSLVVTRTGELTMGAGLDTEALGVFLDSLYNSRYKDEGILFALRPFARIINGATGERITVLRMGAHYILSVEERLRHVGDDRLHVEPVKEYVAPSSVFASRSEAN